MKRILVILLFCSIKENLPAQTNIEDIPTNSYEKIYKKAFPSLRYSYDKSGQIHDYSGNWDFDGDKKVDSVFLVGNGGAHLYFHLRIILSSDGRNREFPLLFQTFQYSNQLIP